MIVLKGRVLDGNGGAPIEKGAVVLEDNRIRMVCRQSELPDDPTAEVYELEDGTIMPGLIDAHVHMGWGSATAVDWISMTPQLSMARALRDMAQLRQQGYTAFRDLGSDVLLMRSAVAEGLLDVPRIFGAGRIISQIGGHGDVYQKLSLEASQRAYSPAFIVNGVDEVRRACRINARNGADLIKIMTTGGVFSQGDKATPHSHFSQEEIRAAVEEALRRHPDALCVLMRKLYSFRQIPELLRLQKLLLESLQAGSSLSEAETPLRSTRCFPRRSAAICWVSATSS